MPGNSSPRISASIRNACSSPSFPEDEEAFSLWRNIAGLPKSGSSASRRRTISGRWETPAPAVPAPKSSTIMAPKSLAGPPGGEDADGDRFVEIWNLVFMQYEQISKNDASPLPKPSIDTGMGLERIAAVLQGIHNNYETDLFKAIIRASVEAHRRPGRRPGASEPSRHRRSSQGVELSSSPMAYCPRMKAAATFCAASCAAPCATPTSRRRGAAALSPSAGSRHEMGAAYPELHRGRGAHQRDIEDRGNPLPQNARHGPTLLDEAIGRAEKRRHACRAMSLSSFTTPMAFRWILRRTL